MTEEEIKILQLETAIKERNNLVNDFKKFVKRLNNLDYKEKERLNKQRG